MNTIPRPPSSSRRPPTAPTSRRSHIAAQQQIQSARGVRSPSAFDGLFSTQGAGPQDTTPSQKEVAGGIQQILTHHANNHTATAINTRPHTAGQRTPSHFGNGNSSKVGGFVSPAPRHIGTRSASEPYHVSPKRSPRFPSDGHDDYGYYSNARGGVHGLTISSAVEGCPTMYAGPIIIPTRNGDPATPRRGSPRLRPASAGATVKGHHNHRSFFPRVDNAAHPVTFISAAGTDTKSSSRGQGGVLGGGGNSNSGIIVSPATEWTFEVEPIQRSPRFFGLPQKNDLPLAVGAAPAGNLAIAPSGTLLIAGSATATGGGRSPRHPPPIPLISVERQFGTADHEMEAVEKVFADVTRKQWRRRRLFDQSQQREQEGNGRGRQMRPDSGKASPRVAILKGAAASGGGVGMPSSTSGKRAKPVSVDYPSPREQKTTPQGQQLLNDVPSSLATAATADISALPHSRPHSASWDHPRRLSLLMASGVVKKGVRCTLDETAGEWVKVSATPTTMDVLPPPDPTMDAAAERNQKMQTGANGTSLIKTSVVSFGINPSATPTTAGLGMADDVYTDNEDDDDDESPNRRYDVDTTTVPQDPDAESAMAAMMAMNLRHGGDIPSRATTSTPLQRYRPWSRLQADAAAEVEPFHTTAAKAVEKHRKGCAMSEARAEDEALMSAASGESLRMLRGNSFRAGFGKGPRSPSLSLGGGGNDGISKPLTRRLSVLRRHTQHLPFTVSPTRRKGRIVMLDARVGGLVFDEETSSVMPFSFGQLGDDHVTTNFGVSDSVLYQRRVEADSGAVRAVRMMVEQRNSPLKIKERRGSGSASDGSGDESLSGGGGGGNGSDNSNCSSPFGATVTPTTRRRSGSGGGGRSGKSPQSHTITPRDTSHRFAGDIVFNDVSKVFDPSAANNRRRSSITFVGDGGVGAEGTLITTPPPAEMTMTDDDANDPPIPQTGSAIAQQLIDRPHDTSSGAGSLEYFDLLKKHLVAIQREEAQKEAAEAYAQQALAISITRPDDADDDDSCATAAGGEVEMVPRLPNALPSIEILRRPSLPAKGERLSDRLAAELLREANDPTAYVHGLDNPLEREWQASNPGKHRWYYDKDGIDSEAKRLLAVASEGGGGSGGRATAVTSAGSGLPVSPRTSGEKVSGGGSKPPSTQSSPHGKHPKMLPASYWMRPDGSYRSVFDNHSEPRVAPSELARWMGHKMVIRVVGEEYGSGAYSASSKRLGGNKAKGTANAIAASSPNEPTPTRRRTSSTCYGKEWYRSPSTWASVAETRRQVAEANEAQKAAHDDKVARMAKGERK